MFIGVRCYDNLIILQFVDVELHTGITSHYSDQVCKFLITFRTYNLVKSYFKDIERNATYRE